MNQINLIGLNGIDFMLVVASYEERLAADIMLPDGDFPFELHLYVLFWILTGHNLLGMKTSTT